MIQLVFLILLLFQRAVSGGPIDPAATATTTTESTTIPVTTETTTIPVTTETTTIPVTTVTTTLPVTTVTTTLPVTTETTTLPVTTETTTIPVTTETTSLPVTTETTTLPVTTETTSLPVTTETTTLPVTTETTSLPVTTETTTLPVTTETTTPTSTTSTTTTASTTPSTSKMTTGTTVPQMTKTTVQRLPHVPIHRLLINCKSFYFDHFYTNSKVECGSVMKNPKVNYEGIIGYMTLSFEPPAIVPIFRLYAPRIDHHMYAGIAETIALVIRGGWMFEGLLGFCSSSQLPGMIPLHRFYNTANSDHLFTTDQREVDHLTTGQFPEWRYEGVVCYIYAYP